MEKGPIIQLTEFYLGAIPPITSGTRADHMRPRKATAITVRARKRPNWNVFDISPPPIIIMGPVPPHGNMPDACSKFGLAAGRKKEESAKDSGWQHAICHVDCTKHRRAKCLVL